MSLFRDLEAVDGPWVHYRDVDSIAFASTSMWRRSATYAYAFAEAVLGLIVGPYRSENANLCPRMRCKGTSS